MIKDDEGEQPLIAPDRLLDHDAPPPKQLTVKWGSSRFIVSEAQEIAPDHSADSSGLVDRVCVQVMPEMKYYRTRPTELEEAKTALRNLSEQLESFRRNKNNPSGKVDVEVHSEDLDAAGERVPRVLFSTRQRSYHTREHEITMLEEIIKDMAKNVPNFHFR